MKRIFLIVISVLLFAAAARADVLHLKSGKTVEGTIVEETDDYYKVESSGVVLTYYEDEVTRVERGEADETESVAPPEAISDAPPEVISDAPPEVISGASPETVSGDTPGSPKETYRAYVDALYNDDMGFFDYIVEENVPPESEMEKMKMGIAFVKAMKPKEYEVVEETVDGDEVTLVIKGTTGMGPSMGTVRFVVEDGAWKIQKEDWASQTAMEIHERRAAAAEGFSVTGSGTVAGKVTMPSGVDADGKLYFKLTPFGPMEFEGINTTYVLEAEELGSEEITYRFDDLPLGEYFVVAVWDLAEPFCENDRACPGFKGDYTGGSPVVKIESPGETATADIMFMNLLQ